MISCRRADPQIRARPRPNFWAPLLRTYPGRPDQNITPGTPRSEARVGEIWAAFVEWFARNCRKTEGYFFFFFSEGEKYFRPVFSWPPSKVCWSAYRAQARKYHHNLTLGTPSSRAPEREIWAGFVEWFARNGRKTEGYFFFLREKNIFAGVFFFLFPAHLPKYAGPHIAPRRESTTKI